MAMGQIGEVLAELHGSSQPQEAPLSHTTFARRTANASRLLPARHSVFQAHQMGASIAPSITLALAKSDETMEQAAYC